MQPATIHEELGNDFYDRVEPARFPALTLRHRDQRWAARIGLDGLSEGEWLAHFGRFEPLPGSLARPLALRYHGHQFRAYNPDLGDGRGFLFAQLRDLHDGRLLDLGTKGSGTTPWSRGADGRLTLKGGVREVLATAMLEALGVDTSKSLSLIETGERLMRHDEPSPTRASVLVRLSHSHIRIGTFQRFAALRQPDRIERLMEHTIRHYMPDVGGKSGGGRAAAFLDRVAANVARLGAQWMAAGFVHGVLNTDNINVTGESFDYGPWRFLPTYDPGFTAAYFDEGGLYAYGRQPDALLWNLVRLAECLLPLAPAEALRVPLEGFAARFHAALEAALLRRLGLASAGEAADRALGAAWWRWLAASGTGFEQAIFDAYAKRRLPADPAFDPVRELLRDHPVAAEANPDHPYFAAARPCTMLIEEVESLWDAIDRADDWRPLRAKLDAIETMRQAYGHTPERGLA